MFIGIDVGGTNTSGGLAGPDGRLQAKVRRATRRGGGAEAGIQLISEIIAELCANAEACGSGVDRIGIGFGGPVDFRQGVVVLSHHVDGWEGMPLKARLEERFKIPVVVDNDANAGTLGEWRFGAGAGLTDLFYINIGTGIGGGIISGARLIRGHKNLAGEIGHTTVLRGGAPCTCGKLGCLESCASGEAIARRASEALGRTVSGKELFQLAEQKDPAAQKVLSGIIEDLGQGIGTAVSLLNPQAIIIGGGLSEAPESLFLEPLRAAIPRYCLKEAAAGLRVEAARLRYDAGIMGALALAIS
jgi:glucokinase